MGFFVTLDSYLSEITQNGYEKLHQWGGFSNHQLIKFLILLITVSAYFLHKYQYDIATLFFFSVTVVFQLLIGVLNYLLEKWEDKENSTKKEPHTEAIRQNKLWMALKVFNVFTVGMFLLAFNNITTLFVSCIILLIVTQMYLITVHSKSPKKVWG